MNSTFSTPQKMLSSASAAPSYLFVDQQHHHQGSFGSSGSASSHSVSSLRTPGSVKRSGRFHLLPLMNRTPIARLNGRVVNPFEASLTERLHLPMICSPSLFHRPATPQMSSTQFEWTIEEVASLGPANVEADETQFIMQTDPEIEARAQEAITSYFRDNIILPSPINCPLRDAAAKIKLLPVDGDLDEEDAGDHQQRRESLDRTKSAKRNKTRDGICQTILTFPPKLSKEMEDLLAGFCTYTEDQQQQEVYALHNDSSNASLRRKLFDTSLTGDDLGVSKHETDAEEHRLRVLEQQRQHEALRREVKPMGTPELNLEVKTRTRHFGSPTDNHLELSETKKESFGSLSPILSSSTGSTPAAHVIETMQRHHSSSTSSLYRSTPERLSQRSISISSVEMSSVHGSAMKGVQQVRSAPVGARQMRETERDNSDDSVEDEMQVSHWSDMNTTTNRSILFQPFEHDQQRTPMRRQNRSASRKNLSRSFSQIMNEEFNDDEGEEEHGDVNGENGIRYILPLIKSELIGEDAAMGGGCGEELEQDNVFAVGHQQRRRLQDPKRLYVRTASDSIYRTDSGFNDDDLTSSSARSGHPSFSTPTTMKEQQVVMMSHQMTMNDDVSMRSFRCD